MGIATKPTPTLYDADFYAWTLEQAALLRQGQIAIADLANIAEELETLGRKEASELRSRYTVLAHHLLKEMLQPTRTSRNWRMTILSQRLQIARHIDDNPGLKAKADVLFAQAYADARKLAAAETGIAVEAFPVASPFSRGQALDQSWHPPAARSDPAD